MSENERECMEKILDYTAQMNDAMREKFLLIAEGFNMGICVASAAAGSDTGAA